MEFRWCLMVAIVLISIPHMYAIDTSDWDTVDVNNVNFKIPDRFSDGVFNEKGTCYSTGDPFDFLIFSLINYNNLKSMYGSSSTSTSLLDVEQRDISGHDAVILHKYNNYYDYEYLEVFFTTGTKIFRIHYNSSNVTSELEKIIESTPKSKMSEESFLNKLDNAQRDYIQEEIQENLELDAEEYYRNYNDHQRFYYWGTNGVGVGGTY